MADYPVRLNNDPNYPNLLATGLTALNAEVKIGFPRLTGMRELVIYVVFDATAAAGSIVVEAAHDATFTGVWSTLSTVAWAAGNRVHHVAITGCHLAVRVRVASAVTSGTVTIYGAAN